MEEPQAATEAPTGVRWVAAALLLAGVVAGVLGHLLLPRVLVVLLVAILVWAAVTIWWRSLDHPPPALPSDHVIIEQRRRDRPRRLRAGESYDKAVKLTDAPNVPFAEAICRRLHANGIEAFYKRTSTRAAVWTGMGDFEPVEVWVAEHQLERARALLPPE